MASCFVISPIGKEDSEVRQHADEVWKCIIEPALLELNIKGYRADHLLEAGRITEQMYASILTEEFCIAVLTFQNPNVFYEVAIAQSAGKPVIMLIQKGSVLPFDLHNVRVIEYDLKPLPIFEKVYVRRLVQMIDRIEKTGWKRDVPFGANLTPLGGGTPEVAVLMPAETQFRTEDWLNVINVSKQSISIAAYGLSSWRAFPRVQESLRNAAERGCRMRIMTYSEKNLAFEYVFNWEKMSSDLKGMGARFQSIREFFEETLRGHPACEVRALVRGILFQQIVIADDELILLPFTFCADTGHGPVLRVKRAYPLFTLMQYEFDSLWDKNATAA